MSEDEETEGRPTDPETWFKVPNVCGSCIAWRTGEPKPGDAVATGSCKLRPEMGRVPASLKKCDRYMARGGFSYQPSETKTRSKRSKVLSVQVVKKNADGEDVMVQAKAPRPSRESGGGAETYERREPTSVQTVGPKEPFPRAPAPKTVSLGEGESVPLFEAAVKDLLRTELGRSRREIHPRFNRGGRVTLKPTEGKELSYSNEYLFAMLNKLRASLDAFEKVAVDKKDVLGAELSDEIVKSLRAAQGSMTTFNVLYADREDYFSSK